MSAATQPTKPSDGTASGKSQRVLACVLCQQRKIKCDRKFPCVVCRKAGVQCVPAALIPRQRRRRFPERELLDRLRHYEDLLRENDIPFEPMHPQSAASNKTSPSNDNHVESPDDPLEDTPSDKLKQENILHHHLGLSTNLWSAMAQEDQPNSDDDDSGSDLDHFVAFKSKVRPSFVQKVWEQVNETNDHLFFGSSSTHVPLTTLHPPTATIFRLWQVYCDNVNPLLKVTHAPTLQLRIIEATSNLAAVDPALEALMFSIYAVSICTMQESRCQNMFGSAKRDLLTGYQFACWQALSNCGILRSTDTIALTALFLYLVSAKPDADPASLSCMLGVAVRVAHRMGLPRELSNAKHPPLEAELRRRLWWALVLFDGRICELSLSSSSSFDPIADTRVPSNINDMDLRSETKDAPQPYERPTDSIFAVVRAHMGDLVRNSSFHINFCSPVFRNIVRKPQLGVTAPEGQECAAFEKAIEEHYLRHCSPDVPLHYMTIWNTRCQLAKMYILQHYVIYNRPSATQTEEQRDMAMSYAIRMLEADTKIMTSPLTQGFIWFLNFYMPALAYFHSLQDLKKRPLQKHADAIWIALDANYHAHFVHAEDWSDSPLVKLIDGLIWPAWEAREQAGAAVPQPPLVVTVVREKMMRAIRETELHDSAAKMTMQEPMMPLMTTTNDGTVMAYNFGNALPDVFGQAGMMMDMTGDPALDWSTFDWNSMHTGGW